MSTHHQDSLIDFKASETRHQQDASLIESREKGSTACPMRHRTPK